MDRVLRRKLVNLINASNNVLNTLDEEVTDDYYNFVMNELSKARNELRDEIFQEKYDESAI